jgi:hypothetical protein
MNNIVAKMVINLHTDGCRLCKRRDNEEGPQLESCVSHFQPEMGQIVLVGPPDFLDQAVHSEALEHSGDLGAGFVRHDDAKRTVLESMDGKFSTDHSLKELQVFAVEEIEPAIGSLTIRGGLRDLVKIFDAHGGLFDGGDEFQVTSVRRFHQFPKNGKAINGFLQRGFFHFPSAIPMFHLPVVFEKTDVIDGRLNAQNDPLFVIHLNRDPAHMMLNSSSFDSGMEIIADLSLIGPVEFSSQEGCDLLGFDGVDRRTDDGLIKRAQIPLEFESHIRGKLDLHQGPMIPRREMPEDRTELFRDVIQSPVEEFHREGIGEGLGFLEILRVDKRIVQKMVGEPVSLEKAGQVMVSVKIKLQPEGGPGGYSQIAQPQLFQDDVKIVVKAFGCFPPKKRLARLFIMPGFKRGTRLHGRKDMDQSGMIPALGDDLLDPLFLTEILLPDKLDLQSILLGQLLRPHTDFVPQGFDKLGIIENANALGSQMTTHGIGITDIGKCSGDDDPIKAREDSSNFTGVSFCQRTHGFSLMNSRKDSLYL